jgi:hypothetical protein
MPNCMSFRVARVKDQHTTTITLVTATKRLADSAMCPLRFTITTAELQEHLDIQRKKQQLHVWLDENHEIHQSVLTAFVKKLDKKDDESMFLYCIQKTLFAFVPVEQCLIWSV